MPQPSRWVAPTISAVVTRGIWGPGPTRHQQIPNAHAAHVVSQGPPKSGLAYTPPSQ